MFKFYATVKFYNILILYNRIGFFLLISHKIMSLLNINII